MELAGEGPREGMESWSYWPTESRERMTSSEESMMSFSQS